MRRSTRFQGTDKGKTEIEGQEKDVTKSDIKSTEKAAGEASSSEAPATKKRKIEKTVLAKSDTVELKPSTSKATEMEGVDLEAESISDGASATEVESQDEEEFNMRLVKDLMGQKVKKGKGTESLERSDENYLLSWYRPDALSNIAGAVELYGDKDFVDFADTQLEADPNHQAYDADWEEKQNGMLMREYLSNRDHFKKLVSGTFPSSNEVYHDEIILVVKTSESNGPAVLGW